MIKVGGVTFLKICKGWGPSGKSGGWGVSIRHREVGILRYAQGMTPPSKAKSLLFFYFIFYFFIIYFIFYYFG